MEYLAPIVKEIKPPKVDPACDDRLLTALSVAESCAHTTGAFNPRVVWRHRLKIARHLCHRNGFGALAPGCNHDAENALLNQFNTFGSQPRRQHAVSRRGYAAALHVAQNGHARLQVSKLLQLFRQPPCAARMSGFK